MPRLNSPSSSGTIGADDSLGGLFIPAVATPSVNVGAWAISISTAVYFNGRVVNGAVAQNDEIAWDRFIPAGTYTLELFHSQDAGRGIYTVTLDGVGVDTLGGSAGTIDGYAASTAQARSTITGIVVPAGSSIRRLKFKIATKNASSSGYQGSISGVLLTRTA